MKQGKKQSKADEAVPEGNCDVETKGGLMKLDTFSGRQYSRQTVTKDLHLIVSVTTLKFRMNCLKRGKPVSEKKNCLEEIIVLMNFNFLCPFFNFYSK